MKVNKNIIWIYVLSTFVGIYICEIFLRGFKLDLTSFDNRVIGIAALKGVDIAARSLLYIKLLALFGVIQLVCSKTLLLFYKFAETKIGSKNIKVDSNILLTLSTFAIFTYIFHYINGSEIIVSILVIFKLLLVLYLILFTSKIILKEKDKPFFEILNSYDFIILSLLVPLVLFFIRWAFIGNGFIFSKTYAIYYSLTWFLFWLGIRAFVYITSKFDKVGDRSSLLAAFIPVLLIPISIPVFNEVQYSLSNTLQWSVRRFTIFGIALLLFVSLVIFVFKRINNKKVNFARNFYLPIFIATLTMFAMRVNFLEISYLDTFHHGENLISTQQLFEFGKVPFIDVYPTHGLSYMVGQIMYSLANGYSQFSPWLWEWFTKIFEITLLYFVFAKITNSFFAATIISFLPFIGIFGGQSLIYGYSKSLPTTYYFSSFIVGLTLIWTLKKLSFKRCLLLWASCLFLALWRIDFGIAGTLASIFILLSYTNGKYININILKERFQIIISSFTTVAVFFTTIVFIVGIAVKESVPNLANIILEFVKFQGQAQGLTQIISSYSPISIFQYFILPGVAIFYVLYYLNTISMSQNKHLPFYKMLLVYIGIFSLIISVRSFQRQTLAVLGYNPYLFVFLLLCLPIFVSKYKSEINLLLLTIGLLIYQLVLPNGTILLKEGQQITLNNWHAKESRVHVNNYQYVNIANFLKSNLEKNETFIDLSSSPLLYVVTDREFVNYLIPNAYYTSEIIQKDVLEKVSKSYSENKIPIVIFRQPVEGANNIDGVPNEIRSYRLYEFLYSRYQPIGTLDGYTIWTQNGFKLKDQTNLLKSDHIDQKFYLGKLPFIWASFDSNASHIIANVYSDLATPTMGLSPYKPLRLNINKDINKDKGNYILIKAISNEANQLTISYGQKYSSQLTFDLVSSTVPVNYLVRVSSQYAWTSEKISSMNISVTKPAEIVQFSILRGD